MLALINQARAAQGLPAYTLDAGLIRSAAGHNQVMSSGCGLSHQCPGEDAFGKREQAQGVSWTSAGENIGDGGPVASTDQAISAMAVGLTQSMLDEKAPDDGHRRNILSPDFTRVGIAVLRDASGTVWMTQDFAS
ncbi:CAP domain-containing protein [Kitasatospora mediocidica]|uniref:CAP domain-containing protein n=1 Tax=Kitasatospora mediocidica TaxID=58352 RepID=UPI000690FCD8|nr:CAP domain-containing protein [Kitasatospora mediocidica]